MIIRIKIPIVLVNVARHEHWAKQRSYNVNIKNATTMALQSQRSEWEIFPNGKVHVVCQHLCRARLPDTGNCFNSAKAMIDAVVATGLLKDDSPEFLGYLTFSPPIRAYENEGLLLCFDNNLDNAICRMDNRVDQMLQNGEVFDKPKRKKTKKK